jgi:hypothetical protein
VAPRPGDIVCSPVAGDGAFLVGVGDYLTRCHPGLFKDPHASEHFHHRMLHAYDADKTMLRLACMNLAMHGVTNPAIRYTNSIAPDPGAEEGRFSIVLAHPCAATLGDEHAPSTRLAEIVMVAQCLSLLKLGGRAAVIVPRHILTGCTPEHRELRRCLVDEQQVDALINFDDGLPGNSCGSPKTILLFTRTDRGRGNGTCCYDLLSEGVVAGCLCHSPSGQPWARQASTACPAAQHVGTQLAHWMLRWTRGGGSRPTGAGNPGCARLRRELIVNLCAASRQSASSTASPSPYSAGKRHVRTDKP